MKPKVKYSIISLEVYPFEVFVSFHDNYEDLEEELGNWLPYSCKGESLTFKGSFECGACAHTKRFSNGGVCMWFMDPPNHGLIAHEIFHAIDHVFDNIGIKLSDESDEAYAYAIQYLTNKIYELIK